MSATSALAAGRRAAEALMLDTGRALRPTGGRVYDPATQTEVEDAEPLFVSRCKIQTRQLVIREAEVGGRTATEMRLELHLPADTEPLTVGDLFDVLDPAPHMGDGPGLRVLTGWVAPDQSTVPVGRRYRILAPHEKTFATARRYDVEAVL